LLRAGQAAQAWAECEPLGQGRGDRLSTAGLFLTAAVWRRAGATPTLALPLWSALPRHLERLALAAGPAWLGGFLTTVTDAAQRAGQELTRLQSAAARAEGLRRTARSQLPAAAASALRSPVLTARGLAERLRLSPQAALGLLNQLVAAGMLREATGRAAWRAFVVA
jgi:signal transduction histidine kinase